MKEEARYLFFYFLSSLFAVRRVVIKIMAVLRYDESCWLYRFGCHCSYLRRRGGVDDFHDIEMIKLLCTLLYVMWGIVDVLLWLVAGCFGRGTYEQTSLRTVLYFASPIYNLMVIFPPFVYQRPGDRFRNTRTMSNDDGGKKLNRKGVTGGDFEYYYRELPIFSLFLRSWYYLARARGRIPARVYSPLNVRYPCDPSTMFFQTLLFFLTITSSLFALRLLL